MIDNLLKQWLPAYKLEASGHRPGRAVGKGLIRDVVFQVVPEALAKLRLLSGLIGAAPLPLL